MKEKIAIIIILLSGRMFVQSNDFNLFMKWFEGEFDNYAQYEEDIYDSVDYPHERIHSIFKRVDLPDFGDASFYVEQYMKGDPSMVYRQRIYGFTENGKGEIVLSIYSFPDARKYLHAHQNIDTLENIKYEDMNKFEGCEVYWKRMGDAFHGKSGEGGCTFKSSRSGKMLTMTDDLVLTEDGLKLLENAYDAEGNFVFGHQGNVHYDLKKCRFFKGWAAMKNDEDKWMLARIPRIHDQGERVALITAEGDLLGYDVQLAQLTYAGSNTPVFKMSIHEIGEKKSKFYIWTEPNGKRIGANVKWIQAGFTLLEE